MPARSSRGAYRGVFCSFVDSPEFQAMGPHARHVLLTARLSKQAGPACIFRCYPSVLAVQTGWGVAVVVRALEVTVDRGFCQQEGGVLWIVNGLRYDPTMRLSNKRQRAAVVKALEELPRLPIVERFCEYYGLNAQALGLVAERKTSPVLGTNGHTDTEVLPEEDRGTTRIQIPSGEALSPAGFDAFWERYPVHTDKQDALAAWKALRPDSDRCALILRALDAQKQVADQAQALGIFHPAFKHPHRWLKKRCWEDEPRSLSAGQTLSPTTAATVRAVQEAIDRRRR